MPTQPDAPGATEPLDGAEFIPFDEFRNGLQHGRFKIIVNPALAGPFVAFHTRATPLALALLGPGIALALVGYPWIGGALVAAGVLLRRTVKTQAPRILLHLATRVASIYEAAAEHGVMEVRRA